MCPHRTAMTPNIAMHRSGNSRLRRLGHAVQDRGGAGWDDSTHSHHAARRLVLPSQGLKPPLATDAVHAERRLLLGGLRRYKKRIMGRATASQIAYALVWDSV